MGSFSGDYGAIALLLYAFGIRDEPSHELGLYEYQGRFFLLGQPQSVFR